MVKVNLEWARRVAQESDSEELILNLVDEIETLRAENE